MRRLGTRTALVALLALVVGGCSFAQNTGVVDMQTSVAADDKGAWPKVVAEHTRHTEVYDWAIQAVDMRATLVTPRLRTAFIASQDELHGRASRDFGDDLLRLGAPPDEGVDAAEVKTEPDAEEQVIVYVCFWANQLKYRDLKASYSIWDVALVRGDARVAPLEMHQEPYSPAVKALLPHADRFDDIYIMRFPLVDAKTGQAMISPGGDPLRLEIESAIGLAMTEWTLQ
jgi:hypothetical protein